VRGADTLARLGGDEFALLIEDGGSEADAIDVANRILNALRDPFSIAGQDIGAGISIGIAICTSGLTAAELIAHADRAMYAAKRRGRGRYEVSATTFDG
jgi:diguanylate cyclase (GGDEF)-like protein